MVVCWISVARETVPGDPVCEGEVEGWADGEVD